MSKKRILPAFLLAMSVGFVGLHRFYAGRPWTALVMVALFIPGAVMLRKDFGA
jgi:TM2 domain-containing membrane protein YozV